MCFAAAVGRDAAFVSISERLTQRGNEGAVCVWCAAHPRAMLSFIAVPLLNRKAGRRLPFFDHRGRVMVDMRISRNGLELNNSFVAERLHAVVAQLMLLPTLTKCPSRLYITSTEVQLLERLLISLQGAQHLSPLVEIARLQTTDFGVLLGRHKRQTGRVLEPLRSVEQLVLMGAREVDATLTGIHEMNCLRCLDVGGMQVFSLSALCGVQTLSDIDVSSTAITDLDVDVVRRLLHLRRLVLDGCEGVTSLTPLSGHPSLRHISAARCVHLRLVRALTTVATLEYVDLSYTNASPIELVQCVKGLVSVRVLSLNRLSLAEVHRGCVGSSQQLRSLSLKRTAMEGFDWVAAAEFLSELLLDETAVNGIQLADLCNSLPYLELLSVVGCFFLLTSLSFVLPMRYMREVALSRHSLSEENVIALLRGRGVTCDVV